MNDFEKAGNEEDDGCHNFHLFAKHKLSIGLSVSSAQDRE